MPNKNYRAGRRAEWRAKEILLQRGHHTVVRAAGSKGPFDLVAIAPQWTRLVQVKRNSAISRTERAALLSLKELLPKFYSLEVWCFATGKRLPAVEVL